MLKSATIIKPIHPGEILRVEFLDELGLSANALANRLGVPANRITRVINGQANITAQTASLLSAAFGTTAQFWLNLQMQYDLEMVAQDAVFHEKIATIKPFATA
ncbi:transcriptional regulator [Amylibacter ulvae]|uniref:Transcriptional regulator n=1 Tax=Paramylibacter ulvae TaxID=1651968 RepID=A0ABQ3CT23_9RHOB|nr:HigA family addiction module antitoxin [Amylibacter ulvae]GHA40204.1 transcriptional regulator [Amylibacter ulvae]